jgi:hypothetical protein
MGYLVRVTTPDQYAAFTRSEIDKWAKVVKACAHASGLISHGKCGARMRLAIVLHYALLFLFFIGGTFSIRIPTNRYAIS